MYRIMRYSAVSAFFLLLTTAYTFAQESEVAGRQVTQDDWMTFMPAVIGVIVFVVVVDVIFILPAFRKSETES